MRLAGIVEPSNSTATQAEAPVWPSLETCIAEDGFDAAIICSPLEFHVEGAIECLEAGLAVLVEKPLAPSLIDASRVVEAAERAGRAALVGQNFRFHAYELLARETLASGAIGDPRSVRVLSRRSRAAQPRLRGPKLLWEFCLHHLDLLRTRFGQEVERVDRARVDGSVVEADLSIGEAIRASYRHAEGRFRFRYQEYIDGTEGSMTLSERGVKGVGLVRRPTVEGSREDRLLTEFASAIAGTPSSSSAADNLATVALVEAVGRAAEQHRPVTPAEIWHEAGLAGTYGGAERA